MTDSPRPIDYSVHDIGVVFTPSPTPWSYTPLLSTHRSMGFFHNQTFDLLSDSPRSIDYSVSDLRVEFVPTPTTWHDHDPRSHIHTWSWSSISHPQPWYQVTRVPQSWDLVPGHFFILFLYFLEGTLFFCYSSLSLFLGTHSLGSFEFTQFH